MPRSTSDQVRDKTLDNKKPSVICRHCNSEKTIKYGRYGTKNRGFIQRYFCKACNRHFVIDDGFLKMKNNEKIICMSIDSYLDGLSSRKMRDQLKRHSEVKASHMTVLKWVRKFSQIAMEKAKILTPRLSGHYHTDETEIRCGGQKHQFAVVLDDKTRFISATDYLTTTRPTADDIKPLWKESEQLQRPHTFQTDGLPAYNEAFRKVFGSIYKDRKVKWIRNVATDTGKYNVKIERLWGLIKDRINAMRGFEVEWSARILLNAMVFHYNFVRIHGTLRKTPAEAAGIMQPDGGNMWLEWIRK